MKPIARPFAAALLAATVLTPLAAVSQAAAQTVLRLDEVAVGELDPGKTSSASSPAMAAASATRRSATAPPSPRTSATG